MFSVDADICPSINGTEDDTEEGGGFLDEGCRKLSVVCSGW